ncbi:nickel pincer cofactor biosynthesis protein LarC [Cerasicoccus maritimus]|uniref:nickel pincer cofactor biosynthesis protein LarC n=1 Tax=Cerasicoccus maritimus TaxID=490089 RepID=UPI00285291DA|nr:nickel pincer cofactor biosynthesis protein LarC [Cerasicoccus maritimus]
MRTLFYQCPAGISGDMNLGAMVALGVDPTVLETELRKLGLDGWQLKFTPDERGGVTGIRCDVILEDDRSQAHDHSHEHVHAHAHSHSHAHDDGHHHHHEHEHTHSHSHDHDHGHHHHRTFREIREMINASTLSDKVKADAIAVFEALAIAEGGVHGKPPEEVHFHEVGAVDSIVDMVGAAICWDLLGVDQLACGMLELGGGTVMCAHGRMPVPAPATARLVTGLPVTLGGTNKEATTPTGAALLVGKGAKFGEAIAGTQTAVGVGVGQRNDPNLANVVYAAIIDTETPAAKAEDEAAADPQDVVFELAVNLDDMTGEAIAFLCEQLLEAGAVDVWQTQATFKKGRVGVIVYALASAEVVAEVEDAFFAHSSTLGVRRREWQRTILERQLFEVETQWGPVRVKQAMRGGEVVRLKPEYDDCARIAREQGLSISEFSQMLAGEIFDFNDDEEEDDDA